MKWIPEYVLTIPMIPTGAFRTSLNGGWVRALPTPPWVASFIESFVGFEESEMRFHVTLYDVG